MISVIRFVLTWSVWLFWALALAASSPAAEKRTGAAWVWASQTRGSGETARFRKTFMVAQPVKTATLHGFADFSRMIVSLNGRRVVVVEDYSQPCEVDVREMLHEGNNTLAVEAVGSPGPAAIAITLELMLVDGMRQTIATDGTWQAALAAHQEWQPAVSFGLLAAEPWAAATGHTRIVEADDYTQWKQALGTTNVTDPATFLAPPGFELELLRAARPEEGSWISLAFDGRGRLIVAKESQGLLRFTLPAQRGGELQVETVNDTLKECRGLLWAFDALYANANVSRGLYRLRDTDGDDRFDEETLLYPSTESGGGGHGRNDLVLGPDNLIYSIQGDSVHLPQGFADFTSPFREQRQGVKSREGHVLRFDRDGQNGQLLCAGMRNPFGIDFHPDGEMFTYDADAEFDMGAPWYRPTRVLHLVPGADFGWRGVTGTWPPYYPDHPDNAPPSLDIGKGSPTAVKFGSRSGFPPALREALFILDWAYGRIVAVYLTPRGASYACRAETFLKGRPLNVTDLEFGPDGAMYFITGGRKTQSGLYRVRYAGPSIPAPPPTPQQAARAAHAAEARRLRRQLEALHAPQGEAAVAQAWPHLASADPWIRHAARTAVEHQPLETWRRRALDETQPAAALAALVALVRSGASEARRQAASRLAALPWNQWPLPRQLEALFVVAQCLGEIEGDPALRSQFAASLDALYPHESAAVNAALGTLLVELAAPAVVKKTLDLLRAAPPQREQLHYLFVLSRRPLDWDAADRSAYVAALAQAQRFQGGEGMPKFLRQIKADWLAAIPQAQRSPWAAALDARHAPGGDESLPAATRPLVKDWRLEDLLDSLADVGRGRDTQRGQAMYRMLCLRCHRAGSQGAAVGPDLTSVSRRFGRRDLLESILAPSKVVAEQYRNVQVVATDGRVLVGRVVPAVDFRSPDLFLATDPLDGQQVVQLPKLHIESLQESAISPMPEGLLNTLSREEILDLLAYFETLAP